MPETRPYVLSIAGFDPSAGAGVLADVKTFEMHRVYGFGICSALTIQNDTDFLKVTWLETREIIEQLEPLLDKFKIKACKIGIVKDLETLLAVISYLKERQPDIRIVLDPVLKASAGYTFHSRLDQINLKKILREIQLVTPNYEEIQQLYGDLPPAVAAKTLTAYCAVLLKGGHNPATPGTDFLFQNDTVSALEPGFEVVHPKHGSGCVLSAAIAANLAHGHSLLEACRKGKQYTETFLSSNSTLLGYHPHDRETTVHLPADERLNAFRSHP
jgi:hydroxymethylpyrimidine/phosphomethylpyrimidine kinase